MKQHKCGPGAPLAARAEQSSAFSRLSLPLTLLVLSTSAACAVSPTGRRQFLMYPPSQMAELGAQAFADMKQQQTVSNDPAINRYVACVADAIIQANRSRVGDNWEVVVFADDQANAFALPGGKVGVYTGLLRVAENADQLAAVIGHEIGHVVAQHGNERMSQGAIANLGMGLLSAYGEGGENRQMILAALGIGYDLGVAKPHSRGQESEADNYGLALMSNAGFNPQAAIDLWHNMEALGQSPPEIMSTHPSPATRIKQLSELQGEAVPLYNAARSIGQTPDCVAPNLPAPAGS